MKSFTLIITLINFFSLKAYAHPGSHRLTCRSALHSGSSQKLEVSIVRSNGKGWYSPTIELAINGKRINFSTPDEMNDYGMTFHNSPLKVIAVTAEIPFSEGNNYGAFKIAAIPNTVAAFDLDGHPVEWSFDSEKDQCNDLNGKATFQGIIRGFLNVNEGPVDIEAQILDCELSYNSGMTC